MALILDVFIIYKLEFLQDVYVSNQFYICYMNLRHLIGSKIVMLHKSMYLWTNQKKSQSKWSCTLQA